MARKEKVRHTHLWLLIFTGLIWAYTAGAQAGEDPSKGQSVYVPVYSHIYQGDQENPIYLAVTLSIRNVDPKQPITVLYADYHNSNGALLKRFQDGPVQLPPSSSMRYVVAESDKAGGSGAFFKVAWQSVDLINPPILESIMIGTKSQQGISFTSRGQVILEATGEKANVEDACEKIRKMASE